jgi:hypothetical protein
MATVAARRLSPRSMRWMKKRPGIVILRVLGTQCSSIFQWMVLRSTVLWPAASKMLLNISVVARLALGASDGDAR